MKKLVILLVLVLSSMALQAQELQATVVINSSQISGTNKQIFDALQKALNDFMNTRHWTDLKFNQEERIECTFNFLVKTYDITSGAFSCELQVQARRPVYGSTYTTTLLNFRDQEVNFTYKEFDKLEINASTYESNLTAILAYYAYVIIGLDLDSFQKLGGTPAFKLAEQIVNASQSRSDLESMGWRAFDSNRNRYALVSNLLDERFRKLREFYYDYHRLGLDMMVTNVDNGRAKIAAGLPVLRETNRLQPNSIVILSFLDTKNDEIINIFSKHGTSKEKEDVYNVLTDLNPTATERYKVIKD